MTFNINLIQLNEILAINKFAISQLIYCFYVKINQTDVFK